MNSIASDPQHQPRRARLQRLQHLCRDWFTAVRSPAAPTLIVTQRLILTAASDQEESESP